MKRLKQLYLAHIVIFLLIVAFFIIPWPESIHRSMFLVAAALALILLSLGAVLLFLTIKSKLPKKQKIALILIASPAITFLISAILHNLLDALAIISANIPLLPSILDFLSAAFFLLAIPIAPIVFIIGAIWSGILFYKKD